MRSEVQTPGRRGGRRRSGHLRTVGGLRYVNDGRSLIRRLAETVRYVFSTGSGFAMFAQLHVFRALAIPPAGATSGFARFPYGRRPRRGRKQYRYHAQWREVRDEAKYGRLISFAGMLPSLRRRTAAHLSGPGSRAKSAAAVVQLLRKR